MSIAITGEGGQLGSELCRRLGHGAVALDLPEFDLTDASRVRQTLLELRPEAVINTAAYTQVDRAEELAELCWRINSTGVGHLAETCRELDLPLVQISTDYVFGSDADRAAPYREDDTPGPQGVYAQSKLGGEKQAAEWQKHIIVRTCGLYGKAGPKTPASNFVDTMLRLAGHGKSLRVVADQHCTPSYVPHVARALLFLLENRHFGLYHVVNRGATTWYDFAAEIFRQAGLDVPMERITTAQYGARAPRPPYSLLDTSKYHSLGGPAMPAWQDALSEYLRDGGDNHRLPGELPMEVAMNEPRSIWKSLVWACASWIAHLVVLLVLVVTFVFCVPPFLFIYEKLDMDLPSITVTLINFSDLMVNYWYLLLLPLFVDLVFLVGASLSGPKLRWLARAWSASLLFGTILVLGMTFVAASLPLHKYAEDHAGDRERME